MITWMRGFLQIPPTDKPCVFANVGKGGALDPPPALPAPARSVKGPIQPHAGRLLPAAGVSNCCEQALLPAGSLPPPSPNTKGLLT